MKKFIGLLIFSLFFVACKNKKESAEFFGRGNYHFKKNELETALHFFDEAIKKDKEFSDAYNNRGMVYQKLENFKDAEADFLKAIELDPKFSEAKYNLAKNYNLLGKFEESQQRLDNIQLKYKTNSEYQNLVGQNQIGLNNTDKALFALNEAIKLNPKNVEAITNLGYLQYVLQDNDAAKALFLKALSISPDFKFALNNLAVIQAKSGNYQDALINLEKIKDNNDILVLNNKVFFNLESNNLVAAKEAQLLAEKLDEQNPYTLRNKGIILLYSGDAKAASAIFQKIEKDQPDTEYIYYYLGKSLEKLGKPEEACKYYKIGMKLKDGKSKC